MPANRVVWVILLPVFWWAMMAVHEAGHVLSVKWNGGTVDHVELRPWLLSQTERHGSAHELMDLWAGPLFGSFIPVLIWLMIRKRSQVAAIYSGFWAEFCLIINGGYLALGWLAGTNNDSGEIVAMGTSPIILVSIGLVLLGIGLYGMHRGLNAMRAQAGKSDA